MKRISYLIISMLISINLIAQEKGIVFHEAQWQDLLKEAKKQKKYIFIDAYASWCGPCKMMAKNIFTKESVGKFFNDNFICTKFDMEKGDGMYIRALFQVQAYPTFLFVDSTEKIVHRAMGYRQEADFLAIGHNAINPAKQYISYVKRYESGDRSPDFLYEYAFACSEAGINEDAISKEYFMTQKDADLLSEKNFKAIQYFTNETNSREFKYLVNHQEEFIKKYSSKDVEEKIDRIFVNDFYQEYRKNNKIDVNIEIPKMLKPFNLKNEEEQTLRINMLIYQYIYGDWNKYAENGIKYIDKYLSKRSDKNDIAEIASNIATNIQDNNVLEKVLNYLPIERQMYIKLIGFYKKSDWDNYIKQGKIYLDKFGSKDSILANELCWTLYQKCDNKEILLKAEKVMSEVVVKSPIYEAFDTYAALLFKNGKKAEAKNYAEKAIAAAKKEGKDFSTTEKLIEEINRR